MDHGSRRERSGWTALLSRFSGPAKAVDSAAVIHWKRGGNGVGFPGVTPLIVPRDKFFRYFVDGLLERCRVAVPFERGMAAAISRWP